MSSVVSLSSSGSGVSRRRPRSGVASASANRSAARRRVTPVTVVSIPRTRMKYNGEYKLSRTTQCFVPFTGAGFTIGGLNYVGIGVVFDPTQATVVTNALGGTIPAVVPNYTEIAALWERVMIDKVEVSVSNRLTDGVMNTPGNVSSPVMYFATDETDVLGNSLAITQQQSGCKRWSSNSNHSDFNITVYPKYQRIVYYTALLSSYEPARGFVVSDTAIPHYGLRIAADFGFAGNSGIWITFKYFYSCKNIK